MTYTEFWTRMEKALGSGYYRSWADQQVLGTLEGRTVTEALDAGVPPRQVWRAVWQVLGLPEREK